MKTNIKCGQLITLVRCLGRNTWGIFNITQVASSMLRQKGTELILAKRQELMSHLRTCSDTAQGFGMWPRNNQK